MARQLQSLPPNVPKKLSSLGELRKKFLSGKTEPFAGGPVVSCGSPMNGYLERGSRVDQKLTPSRDCPFAASSVSRILDTGSIIA